MRISLDGPTGRTQTSKEGTAPETGGNEGRRKAVRKACAPGLCGTAARGLTPACWSPRRTGRVQGEESLEERSLETSPDSQTRANCKQDKLKEAHTLTSVTKDDDKALSPEPPGECVLSRNTPELQAGSGEES